MTTINEQVAASTDDCHEVDDTTISLTETGDYVGYIGGSTYDIGLRWQSVNIAQGATISSATLSLYMTDLSGSLIANIHAIDEDNTATWSAGSRPSQRSQTGTVAANQANWGNWGAGDWITIDIATLIQAIVNRGGWSANNALAVVIADAAGTGTVYLGVRTYDYAGNAHGAKLDITFTEGRSTKNARSTMSVHPGVMFQTLTGGHGY